MGGAPVKKKFECTPQASITVDLTPVERGSNEVRIVRRGQVKAFRGGPQVLQKGEEIRLQLSAPPNGRDQ